jgi:hypothetical protein
MRLGGKIYSDNAKNFREESMTYLFIIWAIIIIFGFIKVLTWKDKDEEEDCSMYDYN